MQAYDIVMLVVVAAATLFGMIKGFAWQVASLASIIVSYFVAYNFRDQLASRIQVNPPMNTFIAMLMLYAGTSFAIWVVFRLISGSIDRVRLRDFDRHMGALFGLGKGVMYCLLITMFAMTLLGQQQQQAIVESRSGRYISTFLTAADGIVLPAEIETVIRPHLERVRQKLEGGSSIANDPRSIDMKSPAWNGQPPNSPWASDIANQVGEIAGGLMNGQGGANGASTPFGTPTSQPTFTPETLNNAIGVARDALNNWSAPPMNQPSGQGGWAGPSSAPLPNNPGFFGGSSQPNAAPGLIPNVRGGSLYPPPTPSTGSALPY